MSRNNRAWIRRVWAHQSQQKSDPRLVRVDFWLAVWATILLYLNLWAPKLPDDVHACDLPEVAWCGLGAYLSDYGTGESWETLAVIGFRVYSFEDGSL